MGRSMRLCRGGNRVHLGTLDSAIMRPASLLARQNLHSKGKLATEGIFTSRCCLVALFLSVAGCKRQKQHQLELWHAAANQRCRCVWWVFSASLRGRAGCRMARARPVTAGLLGQSSGEREIRTSNVPAHSGRGVTRWHQKKKKQVSSRPRNYAPIPPSPSSSPSPPPPRLNTVHVLVSKVRPHNSM